MGGARTALFNWAFAQRHNGRFIIRIEDTDQARSTPDATRRILDNLAWLGLDWHEGPDSTAADPYHVQRGDHGPYFQSQRLEIYRRYLDQLIEAGRAYECFKSPEQLAAERLAARQAKRPEKYDPTESLSLTASQKASYKAEGKPCVYRFRMPETDVHVNDRILGNVTFPADQLEDFVIFKSDGFPTYHFAVVIDDAMMQVNHIIRGQEHLNNTPKHIALQQAMDFDRPVYAHIPLIFNADGSKMSKRDKAKVARQAARVQQLKAVDHIPDDCFERFMKKQNDEPAVAEAIAARLGLTLPEIDVDDFRRHGYLPGVLVNYIALLGWSPGENIEQFGDDPLDYLKDHFNLERIGKSNARFDREKLFRFNAQAIADWPAEVYRKKVFEFNREPLSDRFTGPDDQDFILFAQAYQHRTRTLSEPVKIGEFFLLDDDAVKYDPAAVEKNLKKNSGEGFRVLQDLTPRLKTLEHWTQQNLHDCIQDFAESASLGMKKVAQPIRVAVSGNTISPSIDQTLLILGRNATLKRIDRCLELFRE